MDGIPESTWGVIGVKLKKEFSKAIISINKNFMANGLNISELSPQPQYILHAFRLCPLRNIKIVLLGQDPYINYGEAMGLSFSVPKDKKIPPSLKNIYKCLLYNGLIKEIPSHGDLSLWAEQGVLLINKELTTQIGKSNAHNGIWEEYIDKLIKEISNLPQKVIFIVFGKLNIDNLVDSRRHVILKWGHPSPMNRYNTTDCPENFINCNVFNRANDLLSMEGGSPINWDPDQFKCKDVRVVKNDDSYHKKILNQSFVGSGPLTQTISPSNDGTSNDGASFDAAKLHTIWLFTDGGCIANGKSNSKASWAYTIVRRDDEIKYDYGIVEHSNDSPPSNNRGELTAISKAIDAVGKVKNKIIIVSDSEYCIKCLTIWSKTWLKNPEKLKDKKNLDLILPARKKLDVMTNIEFKHINSHKAEPNKKTHDWFLWKNNDIVDKLCNVALGRMKITSIFE
jgi:uracil-DNA glycosylase